MPAQAADLLPFHQLAAKFDLLNGVEFDRLVDDIRINRLHKPIIMFEGMILDGRNRYRACLKAKVEPKFENSLVVTIRPPPTSSPPTSIAAT